MAASISLLARRPSHQQAAASLKRSAREPTFLPASSACSRLKRRASEALIENRRDLRPDLEDRPETSFDPSVAKARQAKSDDANPATTPAHMACRQAIVLYLPSTLHVAPR